MTTLITGAGMIGSLAAGRIVRERTERPGPLSTWRFSMQNLAERLDPDTVEMVKGDATDVGHLVDTMRRHDIDRVIHTASFLTRDVIARPYAGVRVNLMGTLSALEAARIVRGRPLRLLQLARRHDGSQVGRQRRAHDRRTSRSRSSASTRRRSTPR